MIGPMLPYFVCTLVTVACSFTGVYKLVTYKQSQSPALFVWWFFFFTSMMHGAQDLQLLSTGINIGTACNTNLLGQFWGHWPFFPLRILKKWTLVFPGLEGDCKTRGKVILASQFLVFSQV